MPSKLHATLLGGLVVGVLSALPIVSAGNLCCCLWVVGGGMVAALIAQQGQAEPLSRSEGATLGLLAGLCGAVVYLVLSLPISVLMAPFERQLILRLAESGNLPPQLRGYVGGGFAGAVFRAVMSFVFMLIAGAVFSTIGGVLGVLIAGRRPVAVVRPMSLEPGMPELSAPSQPPEPSKLPERSEPSKLPEPPGPPEPPEPLA